MNLELLREEASAVLAAIETLREELIAAKITHTLDSGEARLLEMLGNVAERMTGTESFYD